ncbi:MAG: hypothetical protein ACXWLH_05765 [Candidatus Saccharimonadales bacterium]
MEIRKEIHGNREAFVIAVTPDELFANHSDTGVVAHDEADCMLGEVVSEQLLDFEAVVADREDK